MDIEEMLSGITQEKKTLEMDVGSQVERLQECVAKLESHHTFKAHDLITQKPGFRRYKWPKPGDVAIVIEVFEKPIKVQGTDTGSSDFIEHIDMSIGVLAPDGSPRIHFSDSRFFEPYPAQ